MFNVNTYERASSLVHLVPGPGGRHILAFGPENAPVVVGDALPLGPAEKKLTAVRRILATALEDASREARDTIQQRAAARSDDRDLRSCCTTTLREFADTIR